MENSNYHHLIQGFKDRTLSREELAVYYQLLAEGKLDAYLDQDMQSVIDLELAQVVPRQPKRFLSIRKIAALLVLGIGLSLIGYYFWNQTPSDLLVEADVLENLPSMQLADGQLIFLDSLSQASKQDFAYESDENMLVYRDLDREIVPHNARTDRFHLLKTPPRKNYKIQLADGTIAWLNGSSSIRFPVHFSDDERRVEITGEVYFDVAHQKDRPFRVQAGSQLVEVLGTRFNVNSYSNEPGIVTTLIEGKINLSTGKDSQMLIPNEQAVLLENQQFEVKKVDAARVIAWTNGYLQFRDESLKIILQKVSFWYSVDLNLDPELASGHYSLRFNQNASLLEFIDLLNEAGIPAKLENGVLIVREKF